MGGFSCHSRFCASCGKKYREQRAIEIAKTCLLALHRHITWTIAKELRPFFAKYKELYDELFTAVNGVLTYLIQGKSKAAKKRKEQLGFISTLHTFGRSMQYSPHIHTLIAEMTIDKEGNKKKYNYFNYTNLRKSFMTQLLKRVQNHLKEINSSGSINFYKVKQTLYKNKKSGFYVHAPQIQCKNPKKIKSIANYISRYAGHPAMSESRILNYDKKTKIIHYYYDPHKDDAIVDEDDKIGRQYVTELVFEFISKLIRHIPEENVHTTRYYGFYANHSSIDTSSQPKLYKDEKIQIMKSNLTWEQMIINTYKFDPLICKCGCKMELNMEESYFP